MYYNTFWSHFQAFLCLLERQEPFFFYYLYTHTETHKQTYTCKKKSKPHQRIPEAQALRQTTTITRLAIDLQLVFAY